MTRKAQAVPAEPGDVCDVSRCRDSDGATPAVVRVGWADEGAEPAAWYPLCHRHATAHVPELRHLAETRRTWTRQPAAGDWPDVNQDPEPGRWLP